MTENYFGCLVKDYLSDYQFGKVNDQKVHSLIHLTDMDKLENS